MRIPVVEPPPLSAPRLLRVPLVVGAFDWFDPEPVCTAIAKMTFMLTDKEMALAPDQRSFTSTDVLNEREGLARQVYEPWDFAPHKPQADVLLVGNAYGDVLSPLTELAAGFSIGPLARTFGVTSVTPFQRAPLSARTLFRGHEHEHEHERVGPSAVDAALIGLRAFPERFDYSAFNVAPEAQRRDYLKPGEPMTLTGLSPRGELNLKLPREAPRVLVFWKGTRTATELQMVADTLWIDTVSEACVLIFRGMISTGRAGSVDRICVALEPADTERPWSEILRSAARGSFTVSADPEDVSHTPQNREEADRLTMARYYFATRPQPPEPTRSLEKYAQVSAELAEQREPRADVLVRHELDEDAWMLEERAWLETMAAQAMAGNGTLAARYGELFVAAQDALATPREAARTLAEYAMVAAAIEMAEDPMAELFHREFRLPEWLRLDRRMKKAAAEDTAVREELAQLLEKARHEIALNTGNEREKSEFRSPGGEQS